MTTKCEYTCDTCLFKDNCPSNRSFACTNYSPADEEDAIEQYIEDRRLEYYAEWRTYMDDWD